MQRFTAYFANPVPTGARAALLLLCGTDGNFYGTTSQGGAHHAGTVFKLTAGGKLTTLHAFCARTSCRDGANPEAALIQGTDGDFYGTTLYSARNVGTVFRVSMGLAPFVETQTASGSVGAAVKILGTNLTGAIGVTFNGTAAAFRVVSASEIATRVPLGATTGTVQVVTPDGTLSSNLPYTVR